MMCTVLIHGLLVTQTLNHALEPSGLCLNSLSLFNNHPSFSYTVKYYTQPSVFTVNEDIESKGCLRQNSNAYVIKQSVKYLSKCYP